MILCIEDLIKPEDRKIILDLVAKSTFVDGSGSAGSRAKRVKHNEQLGPESKHKQEIQARVREIMMKSAEFRRATLLKAIRPCLISRYKPGMAYGPHVDNAMMGSEVQNRSDIACTVFLSEPTDYDGGELTIHSTFGPQEVKLPAGWAVVYPASSLHQVMPLSRGERICVVTWIESLVRDPARRELIYDLDKVRRKMNAALADTPETDLANKCHSNLIRMWAET
jgi:PKHD-type hydroxylase